MGIEVREGGDKGVPVVVGQGVQGRLDQVVALGLLQGECRVAQARVVLRVQRLAPPPADPEPGRDPTSTTAATSGNAARPARPG